MKKKNVGLAFLLLAAGIGICSEPPKFEDIKEAGFRVSKQIEWAGGFVLVPDFITALHPEYSPEQPYQRSCNYSHIAIQSGLVAGTVMSIYAQQSFSNRGQALSYGAAYGAVSAAGAMISAHYQKLATDDFFTGLQDAVLPTVESHLDFRGRILAGSLANQVEGPKQWLILVARSHGVRPGIFEATSYLLLDTYVFEGERPVITSLENGRGSVIRWSTASRLMYKKTTRSNDEMAPKISDLTPLIQNPIFTDSLVNDLFRVTALEARDSLLAAGR